MLTYNTITYTHTHIRTTDAYLYYKLTNEPKGSGWAKKQELKSSFFTKSHIHDKKLYFLFIILYDYSANYWLKGL